VFLLSTTCHEAAHAWVAMRGGDLTAYHGGQVSLDPIPHIRREPFGMILFPILSYIMGGWMMGWASAPYDPHWALRNPRSAALKSLAGPLANFTLAILAGLLIRAGMMAHVLEPVSQTDDIFLHVVAAVPAAGGMWSGVATFLSLMFSLNVLLGAFNLLPIPPLDGFSVIGLFLPDKLARRFLEFGWSVRSFSIIGIVLAWRLFAPVFYPVFNISLSLLYSG
jgi:Zn-dependent protease